ncbi:MAG: hypothetical protein AB7O57_02170 [Hyphomicrobiaceae bacterium]
MNQTPKTDLNETIRSLDTAEIERVAGGSVVADEFCGTVVRCPIPPRPPFINAIQLVRNLAARI